jgi:hypothetical protein
LLALDWDCSLLSTSISSVGLFDSLGLANVVRGFGGNHLRAWHSPLPGLTENSRPKLSISKRFPNKNFFFK